MSMFKPAVKHEAKLRLAIAGPSGSGKTYTSLAVATALANGGSVAVLDTEHGSASKYADLFQFDVLNLSAPFHPDRFVEAIHTAAQSGYSVIVLDSLSHAWNGSGGLLEIVDEISRRMKTSNTFAAWKDATPIQNRLIEALVGANIHVIATMRSKQEYVLEQVERNGRTTMQPRKVGMAPVQRDSMEYEFDVYLDMDIDNTAIVAKTRCPALTGRAIKQPGADLANTLREWLSGEPAPVVVVPKPQPQPVTNGNGNGHKPALADELFPAIPESLKRKFHAVGHKAYGDEWDDKRAELVSTITKGKSRSSNDLTREQMEKLVEGIEKKMSQQPQPLVTVDAPQVDAGYAE